MKVFLDDERQPPAGWSLVRTAGDAISMLKSGIVEWLSLDHDLGTTETGYDVLLWLEQAVAEDPDFPLPGIIIHSANPVGRSRMEAAKQSILRLAGQDVVRVSGDCVCPECGRQYREHPHDTRQLAWDGQPFLRIACDGRRLKL